MQTCAASAASRPSGIATTAVRGVIRSLTGRWANASTPETTAISPAEASAPVSAPESTAARVVRREGSRAGMNGASARPTRSSHGTARATIDSAQRCPTTRGTRYAALTNSGTPTAIVNTPRNVGVAWASSAGRAPAAPMTPSVVSALAVASTRPGFSSARAAARPPRSLYVTQRVGQLAQRRPPVHDVAVAFLADGGRGLDVVLVPDLPHDLLQDILERDQSGRPAELVDHDREVRRATLEVAQLAVERLRLRDVQRGPHQVLPAHRGARDPQHQRHQVFGVHDAHEIVRRAVVHGQARVLALVERLAHLFGGGGDVDRDHVEPRGHHLIHRGVGEGEDSEQHVALGGAEVGFERAWRRHDGLPAPAPTR